MTAFQRFKGVDPRTLLHVGSAMLVAFLVYANSLGGDFVSDDRKIVLEHPHIKAVTSWPHIFTSGHFAGKGGYRPITTLSFAVNYLVAGERPMSYHLVNVLLHLLVTAGCYFLARRLTKDTAVAWLTALIFAVHPIHTEAVTWISGRAELLAALFFLVSWLLYYRATDGASPERSALIGSLLCFFAGILSKENALVLPAALILGDLRRWQLQSEQNDGVFRWLVGRWKLYAAFPGLIVASFLVRKLLYTRPFIRALEHLSPVDNPVAHLSIWGRIPTAVKVIGDYFLLLIWPRHLAADYSYNSVPVITSFTDPGFLLGLGSIIGLAVIAVVSFRRRGAMWVAIALGLLAIAPVTNILIPIGTIKAERLLYLPSLGFCLGIALLVVAALRWCCARRLVYGSGVAVVVAALVLLGARTIRRNLDWRADLPLLLSNVTVTPNNYKAWQNIGYRWQRDGKIREAVMAYRRALEIMPDSRDAAINVGVALLQAGQATDAIQHYERVLARDPRDVSMRLNLGLAYASRNDLLSAIEEFRECIRLTPGAAIAHYNLGRALSASGEREKALEEYRQAVELKPEYAEGWNALGALLIKLERPADARAALMKAIALKPGYPDAVYNLNILDTRE